MKRVFVGLFFLIVGIGYVSAQQKDTVKIIDPFLPVLQTKDPVMLDNNKMDYIPVVPDRNSLDGYSPSRSDNFVTFRLDKPQKRPTVFNAPYSRYIIPTALISYGFLTRGHGWLQKLDHETDYEVGEHFMKRIHLDDYAQFAPAVAVYGLDFMGIKAKHNFRDRTFIMATSHLLMFAATQTLKRTTNIERPDGSDFHSFPSGHTATAFVGAHILFKEYKDVSPWIGIAGYAVASGTGIMRVFNKKHWVSDVVTGAGIGMLSVEAGYLLLPVFHNVLGIKNTKTNLVVAPVIGNNNYGFGLAYTF